MSVAGTKEIESFLQRFRRGLHSLPNDIRDDIVAEVRSHLVDRMAQGKLDLAAEFGSPERYAARFLAEQTLSTALEHGTSLRLVRALLATARDTAVTVLAVIPLALLQVLALVVVGMGVAKPFYGERIGLFVGSDGAFRSLGWIDAAHVSNPLGYAEVLGYAAVPVFMIGGLLTFFICNRLFVFLARWRLAQIRPAHR